MSTVQACIRGGYKLIGGIIGYPLETIRQEVALIAIHLNWSYEEIMDMEHRERGVWIREIADRMKDE